MHPLPEEVRQFIEKNIESVDQLELLRLLGQDGAREWHVVELAQEIQCEAATTAGHLAALQARGLVTGSTRGDDIFARYGPQTLELKRLLDQALQLYRERPVTMIKLCAARAPGVLKTFADAFRIRKEG